MDFALWTQIHMIEFLFFIAAIIFLLFSALSSATETAFFSLSPLKLKAYQNSSSSTKRSISFLLRHSRDLLVTIFILNATGNILLQNSLSHLFGDQAHFVIKVIIPFCLILLLGEIIPKYMGLNFNNSIAEKVAPPLRNIYRWIAPIRKAVIYVIHPISRFFSLFLSKSGPVSDDEIDHMIDTAKQSGAVDHFEYSLILSHIKLQKKNAREAMLPKEELLTFSVMDDVHTLDTLFKEKSPLYITIVDSDIDNILGIITNQQWLFYKASIIREPRLLLNRLKPILYIQETTPAALVLEKMQAQQASLAIVVSEYGSVCGFIDYSTITTQLIHRHIKANIHQEHFRLINPNIMIAKGKLPIESFNTYYKSHIRSQVYTTLGGWLIEQMQAIPSTGEYYETPEFLFHILKASPQRIHQVYIRKKGRA